MAYDGTQYRGFQRQPHAETVENVLFAALGDLDVVAEPTGPPPGYSAAGRTDAGVSAIGQTVTFEAPDWLSPAALNGSLPPEVRAWASADVPDDFHAQYDADARCYEYHLHAPEAADEQAETALAALSGSHDFHNLTPDTSGTERTLTADCERDGAFLVCEFTADGFPREFVRRAMGLVAAIATGERDPAFLERVLSDESLEGPDGVPAVAPEPLLLRRVEYDVSFTLDESAAASAWTVFEERRIDRTTKARVAERLRSGASRDP